MKIDQFGQTYFSANELTDLLYQNPDLKIDNLPVTDPEEYNRSITELYLDYPKLSKYYAPVVDIEEFDKINQSKWFIPDHYLNLDVESWLLNKCSTQEEKDRVQLELQLYQQNNMTIVLKYLMYLIDVLKKNDIVWGVGRGSSIASYCLYLIGIHRINSLKYNLDIKEFFK